MLKCKCIYNSKNLACKGLKISLFLFSGPNLAALGEKAARAMHLLPRQFFPQFPVGREPISMPFTSAQLANEKPDSMSMLLNPESQAALKDPSLGDPTERTCPICQAVFLTRMRMKRHMTSHGQGAFICPICSKSFYSDPSLSQHIRVVHSAVKHQCPACLKQLSTPQRLRYHMQSLHNININFTGPTSLSAASSGSPHLNIDFTGPSSVNSGSSSPTNFSK